MKKLLILIVASLFLVSCGHGTKLPENAYYSMQVEVTDVCGNTDTISINTFYVNLNLSSDGKLVDDDWNVVATHITRFNVLLTEVKYVE